MARGGEQENHVPNEAHDQCLGGKIVHKEIRLEFPGDESKWGNRHEIGFYSGEVRRIMPATRVLAAFSGCAELSGTGIVQ